MEPDSNIDIQPHPVVETPATAEHLRQLTRQRVLTPAQLEQALTLMGHFPGVSRWLWFLDRVMLALGAALLVSGIFFFFAFNWAQLSRAVKLGILEGAVVLAVGLALWQRLDRLPGKIALAAAGLLVGALLAVYGQIYQTGADSYQLFLLWALLISGFVLVGRFAPLWLWWVGLFDLSLVLYWLQVIGEPNGTLYLLLVLLNTTAIVCWEVAHRRGVAWLKNRWTVRLLAILVFAALVMPTLQLLYGFPSFSDSLLPLLPVLLVALSVVVLFVYSQRLLDLFVLIVCAVALIIVVDGWLLRVMSTGSAATFLFIGGLLIGQAALVVTLLSRVSKAWEAGTA